MDVTLDEFVRGIFAVLAFRERPRLHLVSGVFEAALQDAVSLTAKMAERERLDVRFRITPEALANKTSNLSRLVAQLIDEGVVQTTADAESASVIAWRKQEAYAYLARTPIPVNFLERAAKFFANSMETRRIRRSLHRLATRKRAP